MAAGTVLDLVARLLPAGVGQYRVDRQDCHSLCSLHDAPGHAVEGAVRATAGAAR